MTALSSRATGAAPARRHARITLALLVFAAVFFVAITFSPWKSGFADAPSRGPGDVELYRAEVARIHAGETYYDAVEDELRARGYPTRSVFNWRVPLPLGVIAIAPRMAWAQASLGLLALLLLAFAFHWLACEDGVKTGLLAGLLLVGALMPCVLGELVLMSELWAGVLIGLSVVAWGLQRRKWSITAGIGALFCRELAGLYCVVACGVAVSERRYREAAGWLAGMTAYGLFFLWHVVQVLPRIGGSDLAHADGWMRFGGAGFLISTAQMNAFLLLLPQWVTAVYLAAALLGAATWKSPGGKLAGMTLAAYAIAFSLVGNDFNQYWGSLIAPLLCLAAARAPQQVLRLGRAAFQNSTPKAWQSIARGVSPG